jgi:uncharacterized protein Yka (UPF0111/DUF47 family)
MNKRRRAAISAIVIRINELKEELEFLHEEEQEAFDNLPESLQGGERGQQMEQALDKIQDAINALEDAADNLDMEEV